MSARPDYRRRRLVLFAGLIVLALATWAVYRSVRGLFEADRQGADVAHVEIESKAVGQTEPVSIVTPAEHAEHPPLLVFLHGRSSDENSTLTDPMFAALAEQGDRAPVVAFPDGGDSSYWHDRSTGDWGKYVVDEVIPRAVEETGADPDRVAIGGISMGGFGAYDIARLNPGEFCAVGGHSPAIWATAGETAEGAFDSADDFAAHDIVTAASGDPGGLDGPRLWLDRGDSDPFVPGDDAFSAALENSGVGIETHGWSGGHEGDYWNAHWSDYMRFYAKALADC
ncbi:MAG: alpha/beta hydrolase-fold protein [Solirubrobacterales bacterium]